MPRRSRSRLALLAIALLAAGTVLARTQPPRFAHGVVVSQNDIASRVGRDILTAGGNAMDAAVATAFTLAVTHPAAGNLGGGGFLLYRPASGEPVFYDFRETAPATASSTMFLRDGAYDENVHHESHVAVGVPGTVAGLHLAWKEHGKLAWHRLLEPAVHYAKKGFVVSDQLARSLKSEALAVMKVRSPAAYRQFTKDGIPLEPGDVLKQPDLGKTLARIGHDGPNGFYAGENALLLEKELAAHGGLITRADLKAYRAVRRAPVRGSYRGFEILSAPPPSSGGTTLVQILNLLEGYDLAETGFGSARTVHLVAESMRRAFADRARHLGDPDFNKDLPVARLTSKEYAAELRATITESASRSSPERFEWSREGTQTTHLSVVDSSRNAVAMTTTLEDSYGAKVLVPGAGYLLNNEMGDFNAAPGLTDAKGRIGTEPNLAQPGKRMLSSMAPTILTKDGRLVLVTGSPGGRTIISTVLLTILGVVDFGMNAQEAADAPRFHHQWLPDAIEHEKRGLSPDTLRLLAERGHALKEVGIQGCAQIIRVDPRSNLLEGGADHRDADSLASGY